MRAISAKQAQRCEDAEGPRCRCRCGGIMHGSRRGWVGALPPGDPHRPDRAWVQLQLFDLRPLRRAS
jgi:hypothetical protein